MSDFRPRTEAELAAMPQDELIAYHREARRHGCHDEARTALGILVWGVHGAVTFWVGRKVARTHVEDVVSDVIASAIQSSFEGTTPAEFMAWLRRIARRRVADHYEAAKRRPEQVPLPEEHEGDEEIWGPSGTVPDPSEEVAAQSVVDQALGGLKPVHRRVIELAGPQDLGFEQRPARETAGMVNDQLSDQMNDPMTETNVHKILSRFRKRLAKLLDDDGEGTGDG